MPRPVQPGPKQPPAGGVALPQPSVGSQSAEAQARPVWQATAGIWPHAPASLQEARPSAVIRRKTPPWLPSLSLRCAATKTSPLVRTVAAAARPTVSGSARFWLARTGPRSWNLQVRPHRA